MTPRSRFLRTASGWLCVVRLRGRTRYWLFDESGLASVGRQTARAAVRGAA